MRLTKNFMLSEFLVSARASRDGIDNTPTPAHLANLHKLAEKAQEIRDVLGVPMTITSGYRSAALNAATPGSSNTSDHPNGLAFDFIAPKFGTPLTIARELDRAGIKVDQMIYEQGEKGDWVHIGIGQGMRRQVLSKAPGKPYVTGIVVR